MAKNKKKLPRTVPQVFKQPPYFKSGLLVFENGHSITLSNGYYRCTLNCKGRCDLHSKQIPHETLERAYARYTTKYAIPPDVALKILRRTLRENLVDVLLGVDDEYERQEKIFDLTMIAAKQEPEVKEEDVKTGAEYLSRMHQAEYPSILLAFVFGILTALANSQDEADLSRTFAFLSKKITLSNEGKIIRVEFERWGWYILNYIDRNIPDYLAKIRKQKIIIANGTDKLLGLPVAEAALHFSIGNVQEAMSVNMNIMYGVVQMMRKAVSFAFDIKDPKATAAASLAFLEEMKNDPALSALAKLANVANLKINEIPDTNS